MLMVGTRCIGLDEGDFYSCIVGGGGGSGIWLRNLNLSEKICYLFQFYSEIRIRNYLFLI